MSEHVAEYLASGPSYREGEVIDRIETFRKRRPRLRDDRGDARPRRGREGIGGTRRCRFRRSVPQSALGIAR